MEGSWTQIKLNEIDTFQALEVTFEVGGVEWPTNTMVQTWASFEE